MYQDQDSIKVFERIHARDRLRELARHMGDASPSDVDLFESHARAEARDGLLTVALAILAIATVIGAVAWHWR